MSCGTAALTNRWVIGLLGAFILLALMATHQQWKYKNSLNSYSRDYHYQITTDFSASSQSTPTDSRGSLPKLNVATVRRRNQLNVKHTNDVCSGQFGSNKNKQEAQWSNISYIRSIRHHFNFILVDSVNRYLYCHVPKVSSTIWKSIFIKLRFNVTASRGSHLIHFSNLTAATHLSNYKPSQISHILKTYYKFAFVRHPFERLLSAYNDKLIDHPNLQDTSILKRLKPASKKLTFAIFVEEVLNDWHERPRDHSVNRHWQPQWQLCRPCVVGYDFIGRYENMWSDSNYLLRHVLQVSPSRAYFPRKSQLSEVEKNYWKRNTKGQLNKELKMLNRDVLEKLKHMYVKDMMLLNYH